MRSSFNDLTRPISLTLRARLCRRRVRIPLPCICTLVARATKHDGGRCPPRPILSCSTTSMCMRGPSSRDGRVGALGAGERVGWKLGWWKVEVFSIASHGPVRTGARETSMCTIYEHVHAHLHAHIAHVCVPMRLYAVRVSRRVKSNGTHHLSSDDDGQDVCIFRVTRCDGCGVKDWRTRSLTCHIRVRVR